MIGIQLKNALRAALMSGASSSVPDSYTHLDVYKSQLQYAAPCSLVCLVDSKDLSPRVGSCLLFIVVAPFLSQWRDFQI